MDPIRDGTVSARDLRLRFEFTGLDPDVAVTPPETPRGFGHVAAGPVHLHFSVPVVEWGRDAGRWESECDKECQWLDVVLYSGVARAFRLADLEKATLAGVVGISENHSLAQPIMVDEKNGQCLVSWQGLSLCFPITPGTVASLRASLLTENSLFAGCGFPSPKGSQADAGSGCQTGD